MRPVRQKLGCAVTSIENQFPAVSAAESPALLIADDLHGYYLEDLAVGMTASHAKTITETDIVLFAGISGDSNPVHLNQEFAERTQFEGTIAHGLLTASLISTVLGTKLPGPGSIYLRQELSFRAAVKAKDTVVARVTITGIDHGKRSVELTCRCTVGEKLVLTGQALMRVDQRPARSGPQ